MFTHNSSVIPSEARNLLKKEDIIDIYESLFSFEKGKEKISNILNNPSINTSKISTRTFRSNPIPSLSSLYLMAASRALQ